MVTGGLLIADNVISHQQELQPFIEKALGDSRLDATIVPLGKGELVCRKL
jgi:predicted O-methyltransferase YrrM